MCFTRLLLEDYGKHLARLAKTIYEAMAMKLKLDEEQSKSNLSESTGNIRVYRYPSCSIPDTAWGIDVHTDSSVLSILYECEVGGLEVLRDDEWFQVKPICNALIVNLGDMMQVLIALIQILYTNYIRSFYSLYVHIFLQFSLMTKLIVGNKQRQLQERDTQS